MSPEVKLFGDSIAVIGCIVFACKCDKPWQVWILAIIGGINLDGIIRQAIIIAAK